MRSEKGFTLVELLVVMLILGLLAAIAVPVFFQQGDKARDSDAKASVRVAQRGAETLATENRGAYDGVGGVSIPNLRAVEPTLADALLSVPAVAEDAYTVRVLSTTGNSFDITRNANGTTDLTCVSTGVGGCPADGTWGD